MTKRKKVAKILSGICLLGTISAGIAFATSDAGAILQTWFRSRFNQSTENIDNFADRYFEENFSDHNINEYLDELIDDAENRINDHAEATINRNNMEIMKVTGGYGEQIEDKLEELTGSDQNEGTIKEDFHGLVNDKKTRVDTEITNLLNHCVEDTTKSLDQILNDMTKELSDTSQQAQSELSAVIGGAKSTIKSKLSSEQDGAIFTIKKYIDDEVDVSKGELTNYVDGLVDGVEEEINMRASTVVTEAKTEFETIVSDIN